ncbi:MAG: prolyl-tRNA synthetase [Chloroflexi bacterium]|nr:prolyl-tRNA synthetase [Chloroflexota bacterium]
MVDQLDPAVRRVLEAAARKGIALRITILAETSHTAEDAAGALGVELGQIVKSLVFVAPGAGDELRPILCLVAGTNRVDLARLAAVTGEPAIRRASAREARQLSGFSIGGIPPIGHPAPIRAVMDPDLDRYPVVWAAAGTDRAVFPAPPATLRALADALVAPISNAGGAAGGGASSAQAGG